MEILESILNSIYETPFCDVIYNIILFFIFVIIIAFGIIVLSDNKTKNNILHDISGGYKMRYKKGGSGNERDDNIANNIDFNSEFTNLKTGGSNRKIYKYYIEKYGSDWRAIMANNSKKDKIVSLEYYLFEMNLADEFIEYYRSKGEHEKEVKHIEWAKYKVSIGKGWWNSSPHFYKNDQAYNAITMRAPNMIHPTEDRFLNLNNALQQNQYHLLFLV